MTRFFSALFLFLTLTLTLPGIVVAELPPALAEAFAPISGYIIMPVGDEYLVDLDASSNLREGDILTLVKAGEKVIHPVTKEVLGTLDEPQAFLQVTRIKSGYSYARLITGATPEKSDRVVRFEQVPVDFVGDGTERSRQLAAQLKAGLPQLNWLGSDSAEQPILTFQSQNNQLQVLTADDKVLDSYGIADGNLIASQTPTAMGRAGDSQESNSLLNKTVNSLLDSVGFGSTVPTPPVSTRMPGAQGGAWFGPPLPGNPVGLSVADFDGDQFQETAILLDQSLIIGSIQQGQFSQKKTIDFPATLNLLSLDSIDLDGDGLSELYLTAVRDQELASLVIEFKDGEYRTSIEDIPWFLRVADLSGEGKVLIGQGGGKFSGTAEKTFRVTRNGDSLEKGSDLDLPQRVSFFSFIPFASGAETFIAYLTSGDYLKVINSQGEDLWESSDYFGGSETRYFAEEINNNELTAPTYVPQRILLTPSGDMLVAQNEGIRTMQRFRRYKSSRVVALHWNGYAMDERWHSPEQQGYLADFTLADADNDGQMELVMAMKFKHEGLFSEARSTLVSFELN